MEIRRYLKTHEWIIVDGDSCRVGVSDYAQEIMGEVSFVDLPVVGSRVEAKSQVASLESLKAASDIHSPVTGVITEVNISLELTPDLINSSPLGDGWIFKIKPDNLDELKSLIDEDNYVSMVG